jgi:hypothetical protein
MNDVDLEHKLVDMGVAPDVAKGLQSKMDGRDLMALTNALNSKDINDDIANANRILSKYGVHIQGANNMSEQFEYLSAMLAKARGGAPAGEVEKIGESNIVEWLTPIEESDDLIATSLALEGFNYVTSVENSLLGEKLIDWLDENQVDYLTNGSGQFQIKCPDREGAYRVSGAIGRIMRSSGRDSLRDSTVEESTVKEKTIKGRNPIAIAMAKRSGGGTHTSKDPARKDPMDRKAKHKGKAMESDDRFAIGESVVVGEQVGEVRIPHGPNGTIGVVLDGELTMVSESEVALNEGIVGVTQVNPILRLRELAGLPPAPISNPTPPAAPAPEVAALPSISAPPMSDPVDIAVPSDDIGSDLDMGPEVADDFSDPMDSSMELGSSMGDDMSAGAETGGVPGDLPPGGPEMPMAGAVMPVQSEAYSQIEDALNNIQTQLGDVKLSEYKSIVKKLEDLAGQVRVMGRDYLGERRLRN